MKYLSRIVVEQWNLCTYKPKLSLINDNFVSCAFLNKLWDLNSVI